MTQTAELIEYLRKEEDLGLDDDDLEIIRKEKVDGRAFLKLTKQDFRDYGMKGGPAVKLADFAKNCKEKKLRSFSSYKTKKELGEVLRKYGIDSSEITKIPPFELEPVEIDDEDEELEQCIKEIKRRMGIIGLATGRNEAVRCEYISPILYASIYIAKRITEKGITMEVVDDSKDITLPTINLPNEPSQNNGKYLCYPN
ncbi:hypothetical protein RhiirC2_848926 [Rhizophagus irregularis]|uniref:Uncharacterized protein n=1 Tax=Rhizophagus irregularis TaxID=588596 RepID=A0A2N1NCV8_9GLOM|nr:hypothetical protein RhiirC2_848926 [Rhizophagus irregularis]